MRPTMDPNKSPDTRHRTISNRATRRHQRPAHDRQHAQRGSEAREPRPKASLCQQIDHKIRLTETEPQNAGILKKPARTPRDHNKNTNQPFPAICVHFIERGLRHPQAIGNATLSRHVAPRT
jgi:hypothetical protein